MPDLVASTGGNEPALQAEIVRLNKVVKALITRAEHAMGTQSSDFGRFQTTIMLEEKVRSRTQELRAALADNERITRDLQREKKEQLVLIDKLELAQNQLLQAEKMASIGQLAAGVAHEINNPLGFVNSNLGTLKNYVGQLLAVIDAYEACEAEHAISSAALVAARQAADLGFLREDIVALLRESREGLERVKKIVQDLKDFSHVDEAEWQEADVTAGLESTLNVVWNELKYKADVVKDYGALPLIECLPFQLNQVFLNLLMNAAHAIVKHGAITLRTGTENGGVWIEIADTGSGIPPENLKRIFDPFFTTKPVGKGTGLGLSLAYGIVQRHHGRIEVTSEVGKGTAFRLHLPLRQPVPADA